MPLNRQEFVEICDTKLKLVRTEYSFTQEKMALIIGISKKTLVEIEKGRSSLGWTGSIALASIFGESDIISSSFGGNPNYIIRDLAFEGSKVQYHKVSNSKIWWQKVSENDIYQIQQNIISQHYRLVTKDGRRIASSFNIEDLEDMLDNKIL